MLPTIDDVRELLDPYHGLFTAIVFDAWTSWTRSPYAARWRTRRGRANFMWEEMIANAHNAFDSDPRVRLVKTTGSFWVVIDDRLVVRLKKGDSSGFSTNYPTQRALEFHDPQQSLPHISVVHRVEVQYILDTKQVAIRDIVVVCRNVADVAWDYSLLSGGVVADLPLAHTPAKPSPVSGLLHPKADAEIPEHDEPGKILETKKRE